LGVSVLNVSHIEAFRKGVWYHISKVTFMLFEMIDLRLAKLVWLWPARNFVGVVYNHLGLHAKQVIRIVKKLDCSFLVESTKVTNKDP